MIKLYESFDEIMKRVDNLDSMNLSQISEEYSDFKNTEFNDFKYIRNGLSTEVAILLQNVELLKLKEVLTDRNKNGKV